MPQGIVNARNAQKQTETSLENYPLAAPAFFFEPSRSVLGTNFKDDIEDAKSSISASATVVFSFASDGAPSFVIGTRSDRSLSVPSSPIETSFNATTSLSSPRTRALCLALLSGF